MWTSPDASERDARAPPAVPGRVEQMTDPGLGKRSGQTWETSRYPSRPVVRGERGAADIEAPAPAASYSADVILVIGADGRILRADHADRVSLSEGTVGSVFDFTAPEQHETLRIVLKRVFTTGATDGYECRAREPYPTDKWYECRLSPNHHQGQIVSATFVARDINRWLRAEEKLRRERDHLATELRALLDREAQRPVPAAKLERFRGILDRAGEAIFLTDPATGRIVDANDTACNWLVMDRESLCSKRVADLDLEFPLEHPESAGDHVTDTRRVHRPHVYNGVHRRRNGTTFPVEVAIARRTYGNRDLMLVIARDIKGRRVLEEAVREIEVIYRNLFDLSRDAIYVSARDGTVADVNEAALELFGYSRAEFLGLPASQLYARPDDIRAFQRVVDKNESVRDLPVHFMAKDRSVIPGHLTATLRRSGDGNVMGYQCIVHPLLPRVAPRDDRIAAPDPLPTPGSRNAALVIEQDGGVLREVVAVLDLADIPVYSARSPETAMTVLDTHPGDVSTVLVAVDDAAQDSIDRLLRLRAKDPGLRFILMSEDITQQDVDRRVHQGVIGFVRKPIYPLALVEHLRQAMRPAD